jgi:hypothetical protein
MHRVTRQPGRPAHPLIVILALVGFRRLGRVLWWRSELGVCAAGAGRGVLLCARLGLGGWGLATGETGGHCRRFN